MWLGGDEDFRGLVAGVRGPGFRTSNAKEVLPLGKGRDDLERFGKFAGFIARQKKSNPGTMSVEFLKLDRKVQRT